MAFSLEAALVVPLALSTWIGLLAAAPPAYDGVSASAGLDVRSVCRALENKHLYQTEVLYRGDCAITALQVSPQSVLELCSLVADDGRLLGTIFGAAGDSAGQAGGGP
jgi:hypothetical protein